MTLLSSRKKPEWFLPLSPMTWVPRSQERIGRLLDMSRCKGAKMWPINKKRGEHRILPQAPGVTSCTKTTEAEPRTKVTSKADWPTF